MRARLASALLATLACLWVCGCSSSRPAADTRLLRAVAMGDIAAVERLLAERPSAVHARTSAGLTPLHLAAQAMQLDEVRVLLKRGAAVDAVTGEGSTALSLAARRGNRRIVKELLERGARVDLADEDGWTALHWAVLTGYDRIIEILVAAGADLDAADRRGRSPRSLALRMGPPGLIRRLDPSANPPPLTPLGALAEEGDFRYVWRAVREVPARLVETDAYGCTPAHWAARRNHVYTLANLQGVIKQVKAMDVKGPLGLTPLHYAACAEDQSLMIRTLARPGDNLDVQDDDGQTPLHWAIRLRHPEMAQRLLAAGANPMIRDGNGRTAADQARRYGLVEIERAARAGSGAE